MSLAARRSALPWLRWHSLTAPHDARQPRLRLRRHFSLDSLHTILIPPAVFGGLLVTLWIWKSFMLVLFQNKIIYARGMPPFSRSEKPDDYKAQCRPVAWEEHSVKTSDGVLVKLLEGKVGKPNSSARKVVALYCHGNASSLPPRLPALSQVLKLLHSQSKKEGPDISYSVVALSYRGYWTSRGRPSQQGLEKDAQAALKWIFRNHDMKTTRVVLWGQSLGAGVASTALAQRNQCPQDNRFPGSVQGLILETPFTSVKDMLISLYPQKFLPYRYLWPFLRSSWDSVDALAQIAHHSVETPEIFILQAGKDEIVPANQARILEELCKDKGLMVRRFEVQDALHNEAALRSQGRHQIASYLGRIGA